MKLVFLDTKTIGAIPNQQLLDQFGEVIYYPTTLPDQTWERIRQADIVITSKVVLNQEMIAHAEKLKLTGRGGIVNEADLARALNEDLIAGAGVDVFSKEPILPENPLLQQNNPEKIVLTPHITWASIESRTLLMEKISKNIEEFIKEIRLIKS